MFHFGILGNNPRRRRAGFSLDVLRGRPQPPRRAHHGGLLILGPHPTTRRLLRRQRDEPVDLGEWVLLVPRLGTDVVADL